MENHLDLLISLLPFEKNYFKNDSLHVEYVGHPLAKTIQNYSYKKLPISSEKKILAIFPGSRKKEIELNLPTYLKVIKKLLHESKEIIFVLSVSNESFRPLIIQLIQKENLTLNQDLYLVDASQTYELMKQAHVSWAKSGTVTLELALHYVPTIVTYGIAPMDLFIAKNLLRIRLPFYALPNIILGESVFPELIGPHLTHSNLFEQTMHFLASEPARKSCQEKCHRIYTLFADKDPQRQAAQTIYQLFS
jgi:lipid-A-disaccharide synthase